MPSRLVRSLFLAVSILILWNSEVPNLAAQSSDVTIGVGDTMLQIEGHASPDTFVTVQEGSSVIGTILADAAGSYSQLFVAQSPGIRTLLLQGKTPDNSLTDKVSVQLNVAEHFTTVLSVFLPPVVSLDDSDAQTLQIRGYTVPNASVVVFVDENQFAIVTASNQGEWSYSLQADTFAFGSHSLYVKAILGNGDQSHASARRMFTVAAPPQIGQPADGSRNTPTRVIILPELPAEESGLESSLQPWSPFRWRQPIKNPGILSLNSSHFAVIAAVGLLLIALIARTEQLKNIRKVLRHVVRRMLARVTKLFRRV